MRLVTKRRLQRISGILDGNILRVGTTDNVAATRIQLRERLRFGDVRDARGNRIVICQLVDVKQAVEFRAWSLNLFYIRATFFSKQKDAYRHFATSESINMVQIVTVRFT